jgi:hypothetical protein
MIGISDDIAKRYSEADLQRLFGKFAHRGQVDVIYARPNGDRTSPTPSSLHTYMVAKGFVAVEIVEPTPAKKAPEIVIPSEILDHGRHDRVGVWTRGADQIESSCRNALDLIGKGFVFSGLADENRRRAVAEARPFPAAKTETAKKK